MELLTGGATKKQNRMQQMKHEAQGNPLIVNQAAEYGRHISRLRDKYVFQRNF
jgi:hypothetical protein